MSSILAYPHDSTPDTGADGAISLLIVSPNPELRSDLLSNLDSDRWLIGEAASGAEALERMESGQVSVLLSIPGCQISEPMTSKNLFNRNIRT